jgi:hypothetical protein
MGKAKKRPLVFVDVGVGIGDTVAATRTSPSNLSTSTFRIS